MSERKQEKNRKCLKCGRVFMLITAAQLKEHVKWCRGLFNE